MSSWPGVGSQSTEQGPNAEGLEGCLNFILGARSSRRGFRREEMSYPDYLAGEGGFGGGQFGRGENYKAISE